MHTAANKAQLRVGAFKYQVWELQRHVRLMKTSYLHSFNFKNEQRLARSLFDIYVFVFIERLKRHYSKNIKKSTEHKNKQLLLWIQVTKRQ